MNKISIAKGSFEESLVLPLYGRRFDTETYPSVFHDTEAAKVIERLDYSFDPNRMAAFAALLYSVRQDIQVQQAKAYLEKFPEATVVNLGCGLDTSWAQLDNGRCRFLNLDRQETLDLRAKLTTENDRTLYIACDVFDTEWMDEVDPENGVFVMCSGVFHYCMPDKVRALFAAMAEHFPNGAVCFEVQTSLAARKVNRNAGAAPTFTVDKAEEELADWSKKITSIETLKHFPEYEKNRALPLQLRLTLRAGINRGILRYVLIRFKYRDPRAGK